MRRLTLDPETVALLVEHKESCREHLQAAKRELTGDHFVFSADSEFAKPRNLDGISNRYRRTRQLSAAGCRVPGGCYVAGGKVIASSVANAANARSDSGSSADVEPAVLITRTTWALCRVNSVAMIPILVLAWQDVRSLASELSGDIARGEPYPAG